MPIRHRHTLALRRAALTTDNSGRYLVLPGPQEVYPGFISMHPSLIPVEGWGANREHSLLSSDLCYCKQMAVQRSPHALFI